MANSPWLMVFPLVALGLCVGSFLNVVVWRVPRGLSVVRPPSACPGCQHRLAWWENVPVVSYAVLRGRCHGCAGAIPWRYPAIEAATAVLFGLVALAAGPLPAGLSPAALLSVVAQLVAVAGLLALSVIDLDTHRLPSAVLRPLYGMVGLLLTGAATADSQESRLFGAFACSLAALAAFAVVHVASRGGLGMGDVRLAGLCGLVLGWQAPALVPIGLFGGFVAGAIVGVALLALGRASRQTALPFGPFLAGSTIAAMLWGGPLAIWLAGGR